MFDEPQSPAESPVEAEPEPVPAGGPAGTTGEAPSAGEPAQTAAAPVTAAEPVQTAAVPATAAEPAAPAATPEPEEDFGALLESSLQAKSLSAGQTVKGTIVAIGPEVAFVDFRGKSEGTIDVAELKDAEGNIAVEVGGEIEAAVVSTDGGIRLSRRLALGARDRARIADAFRARLPVEGRVERPIKGGYEVRIAGLRAFCPSSQMDIVRTVDPAVHEGQAYSFRITEFKDGGRNFVVSRRSLMQEEQKSHAEELRKTLVPGATATGRVVSLAPYGAFVDLGGVQGLLHVSEMGFGRVTKPEDVVKPGDQISVKVLRVDAEKGKISLGMKQLMQDPWTTVPDRYRVGQIVPGKIVRLQDFGAFVEIEPGVEALAHASTFPPTGTPDGWKRGAGRGTAGQFEILSIDPARKRIGVGRVEDGTREGGGAARTATAIVAGARMTGRVERHEPYGVFIYLAPGRTGLMPAAESGIPRGGDLRKAFPVGSDIEVAILEVDTANRRIRLSRKALTEAAEKSETSAWRNRESVPRESGSRGTGSKEPRPAAIGTLGEKLKAALESSRRGE